MSENKKKINMFDLLIFANIISFVSNEENKDKKLEIFLEGNNLTIKKSDIDE